jgi:hypothetical protein
MSTHTYHTHRCQALGELPGHPWLSRVWSRLTTQEIATIVAVLAEHQALEYGPFEMMVNRLYLDRPRSGHWKEISELLTCLNSHARAQHLTGGRIPHARRR